MALVLMFQLLSLLLISCHYATAQTVVLDSSVGTRQACPGETVTYTCTVIQGFAVEWAVDPYIGPVRNQIRFTTSTPIGMTAGCNDVTAVNCTDFDYVATLTTLTPDITSTLAFNVTVGLNRTFVQCFGTTASLPITTNSTFLNVAGPPSPPHTLTSAVQQYGQDNVIFTLQWQPPQYDGGNSVSYTITVSPGVGTFTTNGFSPVTTSGTNVTVTVPYNVTYTVSIVATNCNGNSGATMATVRFANCGDPPVPRNGSIEAYQNTFQGAEIFFRCSPGFIPASRTRAVCGADGRWNPAITCMSAGTRVRLSFWAFVVAAIVALVLTKEE